MIIRKNSFVGSNLYFFLKNKEKINICNFDQTKKKNLKKYDYLINCASNKKYIEWRKQKLTLSNYGIVWISFLKGLIIGLLIYHFFIK